MPSPNDLRTAMWQALRTDMTVMAGLESEGGFARPLTCQFDESGDQGPIWFFTATNTSLVSALTSASDGHLAFASKDHSLFATIEGTFMLRNDPLMIERLWNPFVAAWYEEGKSDPKLALVRFEPRSAKIWQNESSLWAGIKMLFGADPKDDYREKVADVRL